MATTAKTKIYPFLWYAKDAEAAAEHYAPSGPPGSVKVVDFALFGKLDVAALEKAARS